MKDSKKGLTVSTNYWVKPPSPHEWVSQAEAARIRGVTRQAIARLIKKGRFRVLRIGGKLFLRREDVKAFRPEAPGRPRNA